MEKKKLKQYRVREKKERLTIKDGQDVLDCIQDALNSGKSAFGFTMGNVSLIQIVEMICEKLGGGFQFGTCVWSANAVDIERLAKLKRKGYISGARFLIDPSAYTRKYEAVEAIYLAFGQEAVRSIATHAKFVTLYNDKHNIAITSSMNFTHNPRIEQFEVSECKITCQLMDSVINEAFESYSSEENFTGQAMSKFNRIKDKISKKSDFYMGEDLELNLDFGGLEL